MNANDGNANGGNNGGMNDGNNANGNMNGGNNNNQQQPDEAADMACWKSLVIPGSVLVISAAAFLGNKMTIQHTGVNVAAMLAIAVVIVAMVAQTVLCFLKKESMSWTAGYGSGMLAGGALLLAVILAGIQYGKMR